MTRLGLKSRAVRIAARPIGPAAHDDHHIARRHLTVEDAHFVRRRQDVREHERRLVADLLGQHVRRGVGEGHAGVLGLDAVDPVAQDPASAAQALAVLGFPAEAAAAAGADAGDQYPVAGTHRGDGRSDLVHGTDGFVPEDPARLDGRHVTLQDVQIGAADGDRVDPHDRVARVLDGRVGNVVPGSLAGAVEDQSLHDCLLEALRCFCPASWGGRLARPPHDADGSA